LKVGIVHLSERRRGSIVYGKNASDAKLPSGSLQVHQIGDGVYSRDFFCSIVYLNVNGFAARRRGLVVCDPLMNRANQMGRIVVQCETEFPLRVSCGVS